MKHHLLFVDGNKNNLTLFEASLKEVFDISVTSLAKDALEKLESREIDLVISGMVLSDMSGVAFLQMVKEKVPEIPGILITPSSHNDVVREAYKRAGIFQHIQLPYDHKIFINIIKNALETGRLEKETIFFSKLLDSLPGIFYMYERIDNKIFLKRWNNNHVKALGYSDEELYNMDGSRFFSEKEFQRIEKKIARVFTKGMAQSSTVLITKSGKKIPFFLEGHKFLFGGKAYFIGMGLDISKQKQMERELLRAERNEQKYLKDLENINELLSKNRRELITTALQISKTGRQINKMRKKLDELINKYPDSEISGELTQLLKSLEMETRHNDNWELFKTRFREVHPNFFHNLKQMYPELSKTELRYCAYLRIHMPTEQITTILNVTSEAIRKTRYRIRKKFNLPRHESLEDHISGF